MSKNILTTILMIISTNVIDIDHFIDYVITQKRIDNIKIMAKSFETIDIVHKNYFFLHSWELVILFAIYLFFNPNSYLIAVFTGYSFHILLDQVFNTLFLGKFNLKILFYFLFFRMRYNFDVLPLRRKIIEIKKGEKIY